MYWVEVQNLIALGLFLGNGKILEQDHFLVLESHFSSSCGPYHLTTGIGCLISDVDETFSFTNIVLTLAAIISGYRINCILEY